MLTLRSSNPSIHSSALLTYRAAMGLGDRIKEARKHADLTQEQLGEAIGVTKQAVTQWEREKNPPSRDNLTAVARVTNVPLDWLIQGTPLPERTSTGRLIFRGNRGRTVPLIQALAAVHGDFEQRQDIRIPTVFPCGEKSFAIAIDDRSNEPVLSIGDRAIFDPEQRPEPEDIVLVAAGQQMRPLIGRLRYETTSAGLVTIVQPINPAHASARSDYEPITIIGTLQELTKSMRPPKPRLA